MQVSPNTYLSFVCLVQLRTIGGSNANSRGRSTAVGPPVRRGQPAPKNYGTQIALSLQSDLYSDDQWYDAVQEDDNGVDSGDEEEKGSYGSETKNDAIDGGDEKDYAASEDKNTVWEDKDAASDEPDLVDEPDAVVHEDESSAVYRLPDGNLRYVFNDGRSNFIGTVPRRGKKKFCWNCKIRSTPCHLIQWDNYNFTGKFHGAYFLAPTT